MLQKEQWQGFNGRIWREEINLREFIQDNYTPYDGDASFLEGPTEATDTLWGELQKLHSHAGCSSLATQEQDFLHFFDGWKRL